MPFAKLDSGIVNSSIWFEPLATRVLWITMLAMKDENGFVATSNLGLMQRANISKIEFDSALKCLESPDINSRTSEYDGRRIEKIEGGWVILNNDKYRLHDSIQKEKTRERVKRFRENHRVRSDVTLQGVTVTLPSVSVSVSSSEEKKKPRKPRKETEFIKPEPKDVLEYFTSNGYTHDTAKRFYTYYNTGEWKDRDGKQVRNWKQKAIAVWFKPENKEKQKTLYCP